MKSLYMAIWYKCNQRCTGCPIFNNSNKNYSMTLADVCRCLDNFGQNIQDDEHVEVTISGGEPTLHPDFIEIVEAILERGYFCTILTNAEKLSDIDFCDKFIDRIDIRRIHIVTTIHSSDCEQHEKQNNSIGSFQKSISALKYLSLRGIGITIKHCITAKNVADTEAFIDFIDKQFHPSVDIQLWGIDYSGLSKEAAQNLFMPFKEMQSYIEKGLDKYLIIRGKNDRLLSLNNIPLCAVDPFYWELMAPAVKGYSQYLDPTVSLDGVGDDSGPMSVKCKECAVYEYCAGTYRSMFEYFGDETVRPITAIDD